MALDGPFAILGGIAAAATLCLYILIEFLKPTWRRHRLKRPCDVTFLVPPLREEYCDYAILDDDWHATKEIVLPPDAETHLEIRFVPHVNFVESEFAFGCDSDNNLATKPFALKYVNHFVDRGKKTASPEDDANHYTDRSQYYHIKRIQQRSVGQHFALGLIVRTRAVGIYKAEVWLTTEEMQGIHHDLTIRVEKPQKTLMRCIFHNGCYIRPQIRMDMSANSPD